MSIQNNMGRFIRADMFMNEVDCVEGTKVTAEREFENMYEGEEYYLAAAPILIPWYQCYARCKCKKEKPMTQLDGIVCKCIKRGINTTDDSAFVLALDVRIVIGEIEELQCAGIICWNNNILEMTCLGEKAYQSHLKAEIYVEDFEIYMNGITGEWSLNCGNMRQEGEELEKIHKIEPLRTVMKKEIENDINVKEELQKNQNIHILSLSLLEYKTVVYAEERLLVFKKDDARNILFSIYDDMKEQMDIKLAASLTINSIILSKPRRFFALSILYPRQKSANSPVTFLNPIKRK